MINIDRYIAAVRAHSGVPLDDETAEEMRAHLEDACYDLRMAGLNPQESAREAVRRFGPSADISLLFARERQERRRDLRARRARSLLASLLVAAALAALGTDAVTAARAPHHTTVRHYPIHSVHTQTYHNVAPGHADARTTLENRR